ncbi:class I SAM-dependent methyltransferase [Candidatus Woesearchaeota archaeon]|nr:class I SAM-dependent methyltransferase [Candidatus Woesearchaeota archaeon]
MATKIGEKVQNFYNKTPFPDYELDKFNSKDDLVISAYPFAKILDRSIPQNATVIDVGTGTGQLSAFLSLRRKCVWGIDFSDSSLNKARQLKEKLKLDSWHLKKVDILDSKQIEAIGMKFDYVLCLGVLHHTGNAYGGFKNILRLLKPKGYIAVGLYNKMGRVPLKMRKTLAKTIFKDNNKVKDWFIRMQIGDVEDKERARGWWNDQYLHPHETSHTIGEVLRWFKKNNIAYYQTVPASTPFYQGNLEIAGVWNDTNEAYPNFPIRAYNQISWIWKTHHEGGYWITFGRREN